MYVKIETSRFDYFHNRPQEIQSKVYQDIVDSIVTEETMLQHWETYHFTIVFY